MRNPTCAHIILSHGHAHAPTILTRKPDSTWATPTQQRGTRVAALITRTPVIPDQDKALTTLPCELGNSNLLRLTDGTTQPLPPVTRAVLVGPRWQPITAPTAGAQWITMERGPFADGTPARPLAFDTDGLVRNQAYWRGDPLWLVGGVQPTDTRALRWAAADLHSDQEQAVGTFPVLLNWKGQTGVYPAAVAKVTVGETLTW